MKWVLSILYLFLAVSAFAQNTIPSSFAPMGRIGMGGMPTAPPTLAELRTYHYGDPNIVESPASWFVFDAGTKTITGYNYVEGRENVVIPWEIGGVAVEGLGASAFSPNMAGYPITSVVAGRSVLSIGYGAFAGCTALTSATLPAATSIGYGALYGTALTSVSLPAATNIGEQAFNSCTSLTSVSLPAATSIGDGALYGTALTSVSLPAATNIGEQAFNSCTSLTSVSLPAATSIGGYAFENCDSLTSVSLPAATSIGGYAFYYCGSLSSVSLPVAANIGDGAFDSCDSLTSVSLPAATSIGDGAFYGTALTSVSLPAATSIGGYAFYYCGSLSSVSLPVAANIGDGAFGYCYLFSSVYFGNDTPTEGENMFTDVPGPVTIYYPAGAPAWSSVTTWGGMPTEPYTP